MDPFEKRDKSTRPTRKYAIIRCIRLNLEFLNGE